MFEKKKLVLFFLLVCMILLAGCKNEPKVTSSTINVTVVDKFNQQLSATVKLFNSGNALITSKDGSVVSFEDLAVGNYKVEASIPTLLEKPTQVVVADKTNVSVNLQFDSFSSVASVQEKIFEAEDEKTITLTDLKVGEKAIIGVSPFVFDPEDETTYTLRVRVSKTDGSDSNVQISPLSNYNPKYSYTQAPPVNLPKIKSKDIELRRIERELSIQSTKDELPVFDKNDYTLGQEVPLWIGDFGAMEQTLMVVKGIGQNCNILVDKSVDFFTEEELQSYVDDYINEFDNHIFINNTSFFNDKFDIDQNNKLTIAFIDMGGVENGAITMGYFWGKDFYSQEDLDAWGYGGILYSNEQDIIYINIRALNEGWDVTDHYSTIAHEFQHLLWFYNCWEKDAWIEDTWINEGMSTYSEQVNGYTEVDGRIYCYFDNGYVQLSDLAEVSLLTWTQKLADYGISNLFTNYISEQFSEGILHNIYANVGEETDPITIISDYTGRDFHDIFMDFIIANKLHSLNLAPEYSYQLPLEGDPTHTPISTEYSGYTPLIRPSGVKYFEVTGTGTDVTLTIAGTIAEQKVGTFVYRY